MCIYRKNTFCSHGGHSKDDIQCTAVPPSDQENNYNQYKLQESIINSAFH